VLAVICTMKLKKQTISFICLILLFLWALNIFNIADQRSSISFRVSVACAIVIVPVIVALVIALFKRSLFHISLWVSSTLVIATFVFLFYWTGDASSYEPKDYYTTRTYYRHKTGLFTAYSPIVLYSDDERNNSSGRIVKHIYRAGGNKVENYYIAKVFVDSSFAVAKEFYNIRAAEDTNLLRQDFGKTLTDIREVRELIDNR
jgi:hypothetical protein